MAESMTYLLDEDTLFAAGDMTGLETYDELARERDARAEAEATAAHLAELIAAEHVNVANAEREIEQLRAALARERARADDAERHLGCVLVNDYSNAAAPPIWTRIRLALAR